jgi:ubiquitin-like-conjugating enzyme ATG3
VLVCDREKGDPSKAREFLPADKQYLVTRGVPCLRRAQSLAYTDADEDAERLLSFDDPSAPDKEDEWVETHAGRKVAMDATTNANEIQDIPDLDADTDAAAGTAGSVTRGLAGLSLGAQQGSGKAEASDIPPDLDDIPDIDESLEEVEDAAAAAPKPTAATSTGVADAR